MDLFLTEPIVLVVVGCSWLAPIVTFAKYTKDAGVLKSDNSIYLFIFFVAILSLLWNFITYQVYSR